MSLNIIQIINQPLSSNCYIVFDKRINNNCLIIDPGSKEIDGIEEELKSHSLIPEFILLTHEHFDHIWSCQALVHKYNSKIICSKKCSERVIDSRKNHSLFFDQQGFSTPPADIIIENINFHFYWNNHKITFFITEGHTDASICFHMDKYLFTGDTLLYGLKTVTKLLCGSREGLKESIEHIKQYQGLRFVVYPGHGQCFELDDYDLDIALNMRKSKISDLIKKK